MADTFDIAAIDPDLELTIQSASLRCSGTLSRRTCPYVLEAAATLLAARPPILTVDMSAVHVADDEGANTFVHLEQMARSAGVDLRRVGMPDLTRSGSRDGPPFAGIVRIK